MPKMKITKVNAGIAEAIAFHEESIRLLRIGAKVLERLSAKDEWTAAEELEYNKIKDDMDAVGVVVNVIWRDGGRIDTQWRRGR